ncbi:MAG: hypothetical protein GKR90_15915 [Pseudomonadales bacterium]|nr:hypothetical protein [Pseudomonadales bacterium]
MISKIEGLLGTTSLHYRSWASLATLVSLLLAGCEQTPKTLCDRVTSGDEQQKLALLVGISQYKLPGINLRGPTRDVARLKNLLINKYDFAESNICVLTDERATAANLITAFNEHLIGNADKDDLAIFYFAGHGSQTKDDGEDESDGWDETIVMHDSRVDTSDFRDDNLRNLVEGLHSKTENISIIMDSCHSGTGARTSDSSVRSLPPEGMTNWRSARGTTDPSELLLPGITELSAAIDGTEAKEDEDTGVFTDSLIKTLAFERQPQSYAALFRAMYPLVATRSNQIPGLSGESSRLVFDHRKSTRPLTWEVFDVTENAVQVGGPPLPGLGVGAELVLFEEADQNTPVGVMILDTFDGLSGFGRLHKGHAKLGNLASLSTPSPSANKLSFKISLRAHDREPTLKETLSQSDPSLVYQEDALFEIDTEHDNWQILDSAGEHRASVSSHTQLPATMQKFHRQYSLLQVINANSSGSDREFTISLKEHIDENCSPQISSPDLGPLQQLTENSCWDVIATSKVSHVLTVGGLILSSNGEIYPMRETALRPMQESRLIRFQAAAPFEIADHVVAIGTAGPLNIDWPAFADPKRSISGLGITLNESFEMARSGIDARWTHSTLSVTIQPR